MRCFRSGLRAALALCLAAAFLPAWAHGNVTPQAVDTTSLPQLGPDWRNSNPYTGNDQAVKIGSSAFNQNCARCHGLEAVSGGIAPDLRKLDRDCVELANEARKKACYDETNAYFLLSIRHGKVRNGAVYMPPFEGILTQEAMWAIKAYLETRRVNE
jgi:cytochrome c-550 PedF